MKLDTNFSFDQLNFKSLIVNRRYLMFLIGLILIGLVIIFVALIPTVRQIFTLQSKLMQQQRQLQKLRIKAEDLENIEARAVYSQRNNVNAVLPSKKPLIELLAGLSIVAGRNNVTFTDLQLSPGLISTESAELQQANTRAARNSGLGYDVLNVTATVEGQFGSVQGFLTEIERMAPLNNVTSIALTKKSYSQGTVTDVDLVSAELLISTYFFTKSVTASLEQPLPQIESAEQDVLTEIQTYTYPSVADQQEIISGGIEDLFQLSTQEAEEVRSSTDL